MATVTDAQGNPVPRERQIEVLVALGFPASMARFMVAVEMQETAGDLVMVDDNGKEIMDEARRNADAE